MARLRNAQIAGLPGLAGSEIVGVGVQNRPVNERRKRLRRTGFDSMTALGLALYLATGWATLLAQTLLGAPSSRHSSFTPG